jgi:lipoprotein-anchoring transpeptidase ErfK/SrfK
MKLVWETEMKFRSAAKIVGLALLAAIATSAQTSASVVAKIDLGEQNMNVYVDGKLRHSWSISSGRRGYETPTGNYRPQRLAKEWYSRQYDDAPMPYSVFFNAGYAIHGGHSRVGGRASHGCIRLTTGNAAKFYNLVSSYGSGKTKIVIDD